MGLTQVKKAGLDEIALDHVFTIGASGSSAYTFQGEGLNGTVNNPDLYLTRGKTYRFENGSGGHPIRIQSTSGASGTAYNTGVTNNGGSGTVIVEVQHDAPDVLYYQCTSHASMNGVLYITGALADGGVTTAKLADNAVTTAKITDLNVTTAKIAHGAINSNKLATDSVTTAAIADNSVTTAKINGGAVTTARLANSAVTADKIAGGAVGTARIADGAVTTAKIADDAVTQAKIADDSITTPMIQTGSITSDLIFNGTIAATDLSNNAVTTDKIADSAVTTAKIADDAITGDKVSDNLDIPDNNKIRFGTGNDLSIYHDGTNSTINNNTGDLYIQTDGNLKLEKKDGGSDYIHCIDGGAVEIHHNGSKKFETTSIGANITGFLKTSAPIAFFGEQDTHHTVANNTWTTIRNLGSHPTNTSGWSESTGIYTVPSGQEGLYFLTVGAGIDDVQSRDFVNIGFAVNGTAPFIQQYGKQTYGSADAIVVANMTTMVYLQAGQNIRGVVKHNEGSTEYTEPVYCWFGGFRIT